MYTTRLHSPLGTMMLASDGAAVTGLWLEGQTYYASTLDGSEREDGSLPPLPPLAPGGTPFRQAVWARLREIPYGQVTTYGALAQSLQAQGISASPRAVGGAVGHNPISILIPCHRVVGTGGSLTGYAGGLEKKRFLLRLEGIDPAHLPVSDSPCLRKYAQP